VNANALLQLLRLLARTPQPSVANSRHLVKSADNIPKSVDKKMDEQMPSNGHVEPGISVRMGPVEDMDVDTPSANGTSNGKRKARSSLTGAKTYKEASSSDDDDKPLVRSTLALILQYADST
jgi:DNA topoisomerase-1